MNKLCLHVQKHGGSCDDYILEQVRRYHPRHVKLMDDCVVLASQIKAISPETKIIFRHWFPDPQPHSDPNAVLQGIMSDLTRYGATDYVDYIEGTNEPAGTDEELIAKLEADIVVAKHLPRPYLAASFSTGWPDLHFWRYPKVQDLLKQLRDAGAHLSIHQYYCPQDKGSWEWQTVRHRKFMNVIPEGMKLFVTETGVDCGGPGKGWKTYVPADEYINILHKIADEYAQDPIIEMAAVFTSCNAGWDAFEVRDLPQHEIWGYEPRVEIPSRIIDDFDRLPKRSPYYQERPLGDITAIVIHHTAVAKDLPLEQIANYHISEHGWPGIGYHFVINSDGSIHRVNPINLHSYHAMKWGNAHGIGVCLQGDFDKAQPTDAQIKSARWLIQYLNDKLGRNLTIYGHRETPGVPAGHTHCPGLTWSLWMGKLAKKEAIEVADEKVKTIPVPEGAKWPEIDGKELLEKFGIKVIPPKCLAEDGYAWYPVGFVWNSSGNPSVVATFQPLPSDATKEVSVYWMKYWPGAPHIEGVTEEMVGTCIPTLPHGNAVYEQTPVPGRNDKFSMGNGEYLSPGEPNELPTEYWVYSFKHPSAIIKGLGMQVGTDHYHPDPIWALVKPEGGHVEPEPPDGGGGESGGGGTPHESFMCRLMKALFCG